jgi:ubiquinol-cytochrome c reductase iron-sulfur subunit
MFASLEASHDLIDPFSDHSKQPAYARNAHRSLVPELFVAIGLCTHLACAPTLRLKPGSVEGMPPAWRGGFVCPCHTSTFDLAGRAHRNREAKLNLAVPPYRLVGDNLLRIGEDPPA